MNVDRELQAALDVNPSPEFVARVRQRIAAEPAPRRSQAWWLTAAAAAAVVAVAAILSRGWLGPDAGERTLPSRALAIASTAFPDGSPEGLPHDSRPSSVAEERFRAAADTGRLAVAQPFRAASDGVVAGEPSMAAERVVVGQPLRAADGVVAGKPSVTADGVVVGQPFRAAERVGVGQPFRAAGDAEVLIDPRERATLLRLIANVGSGRADWNASLGPSPFSVVDPAPIAEIQIVPISIEPLDPGGEGARQ